MAMQLTSEKSGQGVGRVPDKLAQEQARVSIGIDFIGIDFVEVAESHVLFFGRVKDFVHGELPEHQNNLSQFVSTCELDAWLNGIAAAHFGQLRSFVRLHEAHAEFHRHAEQVLATLHSGSWMAAEQLRKSELSQALRRVLIALTELHESINKQVVSVS
jgi:hypothetical protein